MTLPRTELIRITKRTRWAAQARALQKLGIDYRLAADGEPLVSEAVYEAWLGGDTVQQKARPRVDMEAVNAA